MCIRDRPISQPANVGVNIDGKTHEAPVVIRQPGQPVGPNCPNCPNADPWTSATDQRYPELEVCQDRLFLLDTFPNDDQGMSRSRIRALLGLG